MCSSAPARPDGRSNPQRLGEAGQHRSGPPARPATPLDNPRAHDLMSSHVIAITFPKNYGDDLEERPAPSGLQTIMH